MVEPAEKSGIDWRIRYRTWVSMSAHAAIFALSLFIAYVLAYDFEWFTRLPDGGEQLWLTHDYLPCLIFILIVKLMVFGRMGAYRDSWRYVGLRDLFTIIKASHISFAIWFIVYYVYQYVLIVLLAEREIFGPSVPASAILLDWGLTIVLVAAARVAFRFYNEELRPLRGTTQVRLLIVGAGNAGESILREIFRTSEDRYNVVGFLDDDDAKQRARIRGIEILGKTGDIRRICEREDVEEVLMAMPSAPQRRIRAIIELCHGMNLRFRTVPSVSDLIEGKVQVSQIRSVDIEDLLGRPPVVLDTEAIGEYIRGKVVMVTGAGGSIGSEMCRQIARFKPDKLLLLEQMENALFNINRELAQSFPDLCRVPIVADIIDAPRLRQVFSEEGPSVVFHAAAHKHVPMMEWNPGEAIKNNILGTRCLADEASRAGVEKFVMISTDKAVNPTSVMGCTKRVAEMYVQQLGSHSDTKTDFVTVRFGNVLGSSGSVVPIFKEQIARGGPVTVTHPDMTRYFMTIPEASQLVLQAGSMGRGGEIFLLDMGEPVKIVDLAVDLITLSGLRPADDIEIRYTGIRPGEKLFEELKITGEDVSRTDHPKIGIVMKRPEDFRRVCERIAYLKSIMDSAGADAIREALADTVPEYTPTAGGPAPAPPRPPVTEPSGAQAAPADLAARARVRPA